MVVTILYRMEGTPTARYSGKFTDVADGRWYSDAVEWAATQGVVSGYADGHFGPDDAVTREQLAAILYRYASKPKGLDVSAAASGSFSRCADFRSLPEIRGDASAAINGLDKPKQIYYNVFTNHSYSPAAAYAG